MFTLAKRNLLQDKLRLAVTLTGVIFAVVLIIIELGLFVGFVRTTSALIDHSQVDLWVTSNHVPYLDLGVPLNERKLYQVEAVPGVARADKYIVRYTRWNRLDGGQNQIEVVGFNPDSTWGGPWNVVQGSIHDLKTPDGVMIDDVYKKKLGVTQIGQVFEINGHRARVVGFTHGIRSFTTSPWVFTSFRNALDYAPLNDNQTTYILVRVESGAHIEQVRQNILQRVDGVEVLTTREFSRMTQNYWTFTTGAGIAILLAAVLGVIVGFVVVAQTIYATTMDHIKEFGTLKAMGAPNWYVQKVILIQAGISAAMGYVVGMMLSGLIVRFGQPAGAPILLNWWMALATLALTLFMCAGAALISINKVTRLDPATVFKG
ncbi:MAG TPA: ABC transporter permease [Terriglobales bacterium]|nr:ABC transporter permease [Terriglobales bacterium]